MFVEEGHNSLLAIGIIACVSSGLGHLMAEAVAEVTRRAIEKEPFSKWLRACVKERLPKRPEKPVDGKQTSKASSSECQLVTAILRAVISVFFFTATNPEPLYIGPALSTSFYSADNPILDPINLLILARSLIPLDVQEHGKKDGDASSAADGSVDDDVCGSSVDDHSDPDCDEDWNSRDVISDDSGFDTNNINDAGCNGDRHVCDSYDATDYIPDGFDDHFGDFGGYTPQTSTADEDSDDFDDINSLLDGFDGGFDDGFEILDDTPPRC
ncbi:hypothetical protein FQN54_005031 [Arachnomyces sp. PD_36]|nr:hypothetical protein FQN54_005031 [Arachnomyces sp. PD_36]